MNAVTSHELPHAAESSRHSSVTRKGRPLRLLHVINRLGVGGIELGLQSLIEKLSPELFEQRIFPVRGVDSDLGPLQNLYDFVIPPDNPTTSSFSTLQSLVRHYQPDVVHSCNWGGIEAVLAAKLAGVPVVIHCEHGYIPEMLAGLPLRQRLARRFFYSLTDALFTVSEDLRAFHAKQTWMNPSRIMLIRNGVNVRRFAPNPEIRAQVRHQLGLSSDAVVIGSVGRLTALKDFPTLLRGVETLLERGELCTLLLVGSGPEEDALRKQAAASRLLKDHVIFTGVSKEVSSLLKAMDVFALPSICEGMSYTLMEAMATGLPVVASRIGGNTELVEEHVTGYLCTPSAPSELADRLQELIKNPERRQEFGSAARKRAEENFSLDKMLVEYRDLYLGLARKRGLLVPSQA